MSVKAYLYIQVNFLKDTKEAANYGYFGKPINRNVREYILCYTLRIRIFKQEIKIIIIYFTYM